MAGMEIKREHNYGIDMLRIVSMFLIVILHIMGHGRVLAACEGTKGFGVSWLLEIIAYPAVNCYALISGFVGYSAHEKKIDMHDIWNYGYKWLCMER